MHLSLINIKVWLVCFKQVCVPKSLSFQSRETTLLGDGRNHLSLMSGDRRNATGRRVNEMPAE